MKVKAQRPPDPTPEASGEEFDAAAFLEEPRAEPILAAPAAATPALRTVEASLALPLRDVPEEDYCARHIDTRLDLPQAVALARLFRGLDEAGARLASGRYVKSQADAVRYVLEQLGKAT